MPNSGKIVRAFLVATFATILVVACGGGGGGGGGGSSSTPTPTPTPTPVPAATEALVTGILKDAKTGSPVADALVSIGKLVTTSGADGSYALEKVPLGRTVIQVDSKQHAQGAFIAYTTPQSALPTLSLKLQPLEASFTIDSSIAQTLKSPSSQAAVVLPAASLVASSGAAPTGQVFVKVTAIDVASMPGDFAVSSTEIIETFGAIDVSFEDANKTPLNLATGKLATIRIPAKSSGTTAPPSSIPLYYFDTKSGYWVREGSANLVINASGNYYEGAVSHFTTWNSDMTIDAIKLTGRVLDGDGVPVSGAKIICDGVDYSGSSTAGTAANGTFSILVKKSSQVECFVRFNTVDSTHQKLTIGTQDVNVGDAMVPVSRASTISLGDPAKRIDTLVYPLGGSQVIEMQIPFETAGITLNWDAIKAGLTRWEITPVFDPANGQNSLRQWKDGTSDRTFTNRIDNGATPNKGIMSFTGTITLGRDAIVGNTTALTFIARLVGMQKSATTGVYYEVKSDPKKYTVSLVRPDVTANGLTWSPMTGITYLYNQAGAYCASKGFRVPTLSETKAFLPSGPWGPASGSSIGGVWTSTDAAPQPGPPANYRWIVDAQGAVLPVDVDHDPTGRLALCVK